MKDYIEQNIDEYWKEKAPEYLADMFNEPEPWRKPKFECNMPTSGGITLSQLPSIALAFVTVGVMMGIEGYFKEDIPQKQRKYIIQAVAEKRFREVCHIMEARR